MKGFSSYYIDTYTDGHFRSSCNHLGATASSSLYSGRRRAIQKVKPVECARFSFPHIQWNKTAFRLSFEKNKTRTNVDFFLFVVLNRQDLRHQLSSSYKRSTWCGTSLFSLPRLALFQHRQAYTLAGTFHTRQQERKKKKRENNREERERESFLGRSRQQLPRRAVLSCEHGIVFHQLLAEAQHTHMTCSVTSHLLCDRFRASFEKTGESITGAAATGCLIAAT